MIPANAPATSLFMTLPNPHATNTPETAPGDGKRSGAE